MKVAVIIPDRNDRPRFLENCLRMLKAQTVQPDIIELVNDDFGTRIFKAPAIGFTTSPPENNGKMVPDITKRYRTGYDRLRGKGIDCILFIENDDWYRNDFIEKMTLEWEYQGRPDLLGTNYTIYYHIGLFARYTMQHETRSSAMSTLIKADLNFAWCPDHEPYTDIHLWKTIPNRVIFHPEEHICLGIKHGEGLCGGKSHSDRLFRYEPPRGTKDPDKAFLKSVLDPESFEFYSNYFKQ